MADASFHFDFDEQNINLQRYPIYRSIANILEHKDKIKLVADLAFQAVDEDESENLDVSEISRVMSETASDLRIKAPNEAEIEAILNEYDENSDNVLQKGEFFQLIVYIFENMKENEVDIIKNLE